MADVQLDVIRSPVALVGLNSTSIVLTCAPQHIQISGGTLTLIESYCTQVSPDRASV